MIFYPDQHLDEVYYSAQSVRLASREFDHPDEPSWGVYLIDGKLAVICDCDFRHACGEDE